LPPTIQANGDTLRSRLLAVALSTLPQIDRLVLATVTTVPEWHPEHDTFVPFPVHAWLIRHPDGAILVDTGVGVGNEAINEWYHPRTTSLPDALAGIGVASSDISAVIMSHLHFDHCGQQGVVPAPVYVQASEFEVAQTPGYTVPEWAAIPNDRLRLVHGDQLIAEGISLLATPGHTPGHQSVLLEAAGERVVIGAQCAFRAAELRTGEPVASNCHGEPWEVAARDSLERLRALAPVWAHLSHDPEIVEIVR
jgi:glyoxylase-like metal-dependent hydrolase (beta-lactamase superfamily II)